ncbi:crossover junction endodeoxyribonuclease RuvC, partial [Francisella tularensis subsp. holarctica]|nr:crossover junction endodeoxyribonuclease RuvC [Francisella tularensis subsp. holarctica]
LSKKPTEYDDDALAIAICHYHSSKSLAKISGESRVSQKRIK